MTLNYFSAPIVPDLTSGGPFKLVPVLGICLPFFSPGCFHISGIRRCSRLCLYFSVTDVESSIPLRNSGSFYWEMVLETKILVLAMFRVSLLLGPLCEQSWEIDASIYTHLCTCTNVQIYSYIYIF